MDPEMSSLVLLGSKTNGVSRKATQELDCNPEWVSPFSHPSTDARALFSIPLFNIHGLSIRRLEYPGSFEEGKNVHLGWNSAKVMDILRTSFY